MCKNYICLYQRLIGHFYEAILFRQQVTMPCNIPFKATQQIWLWEKANDLNRLEKNQVFLIIIYVFVPLVLILSCSCWINISLFFSIHR